MMTTAGRSRRAARRQTPQDPTLAVRLAEISARIRQAREMETERDRLILQAVEEGWTYAQIAQATGLTRSRVGQITLRSA